MKKYSLLLAMITAFSYASEQPTKKAKFQYSAKKLMELRPKSAVPSDEERFAYLKQLIKEAKKEQR